MPDSPKITVQPTETRRGEPVFLIKEGTMPGDIAVIKRHRAFFVGQTVEYIPSDAGMQVPARQWRRGSIWLIEHNRIFLNRM
jgi:hypothetical protein